MLTPRFKLRVKMPKWLTSPALIRERKQAAAEIIVRQTADHLAAGGDDEITLAPTTDGRRFGGNGNLLVGSLKPFANAQAFGVSSTLSWAKFSIEGTTGKGGTNPPIRPKRAKALRASIGGILRFFRKAEFPPRSWLRFSKSNLSELATALFKPKQS